MNAAIDEYLIDVEQHLGKVYELAGDTSFTLQGFADAISALTGKNITLESKNQAGYKAFLTDVAGLPEGFAHALADSEHFAKYGDLSGSSATLHSLIGRATPSIVESCPAGCARMALSTSSAESAGTDATNFPSFAK